jgi:hypothetical protein
VPLADATMAIEPALDNSLILAAKNMAGQETTAGNDKSMFLPAN